jgi:hypothetical protein
VFTLRFAKNALSSTLCLLAAASGLFAQSQTAAPVSAVCSPNILGDQVVATAAQRKAAGEIAQPPLTDMNNGFAWPDTPLGVAKTSQGYLFFGSDGAYHARQLWQGNWYGNNKYGSITRTLGALDKPLGTTPPVDVTLLPNPDPTVDPFYSSYDYIGGGPVYQVPAGMPGAGNLLLLYHAEIPTVSTQSFYAILGLAASTDEGMSWTDLGEIIRVNQGYRTDIDGFDIGDSSISLSTDGTFMTIYFPDWLANGTTHWGNTITFASVARAPLAAVLSTAFGDHPHAIPFTKYYEGWRFEQGLGGYSKNLNPQESYGGELQVAYNADLKAYQLLMNAGVVVYYSDSKDGMNWSPLSVLHDFRQDPDQPSVYVNFVGMGENPSILAKRFYIFYTRYPGNGQGWPGASVHRFIVSCE